MYGRHALWLLGLTLTFFVCTTHALLHAPPAQLQYPGSARSERDLPLCRERAACSVIHRRFWEVPPLVERLCRCAGRTECPATWSTDPYHDLSMHLNTRAQLKFCKPVTSLPKCRSGRTSLNVSSRFEPPDPLAQVPATVTVVAQVTCYCPGPPVPRHWQHRGHSTRDFGNGTLINSDIFSCAKLGRCREQESCGNVRTDLFSAYYHCSCLRGSLCLFSKQRPLNYTENDVVTPVNVTEVLYHGSAYQASCVPYPKYYK